MDEIASSLRSSQRQEKKSSQGQNSIKYSSFLPLTLSLSLLGEREYLSVTQSAGLPVEIQDIKYKEASTRDSDLELLFTFPIFCLLNY